MDRNGKSGSNGGWVSLASGKGGQTWLKVA